MIKLIRRICIVIFALSVAAYGGVTVYQAFTEDSTGPSVTMDSNEITVSVADDDTAILEGVTVQDADGSYISSNLVVETKGNFITPGVRDVTIAAFDYNDNVTKATRRVAYSDYTSPTVSLSGSLCAPVSDSSALLDVITVTDCLDGDLTGQVQVVFEETSQSVEAGEFAMHIQVSNSAGDTVDLPVTVRFYNASEEINTPQLTLTDYIIYVDEGEKVDPEDYLDTITVENETYAWDSGSDRFLSEEASSEGDEAGYESETSSIARSAIQIDNPTDTSVPGTYEITYSYIDDDSELTGLVRLIVVVEEE